MGRKRFIEIMRWIWEKDGCLLRIWVMCDVTVRDEELVRWYHGIMVVGMWGELEEQVAGQVAHEL